MEEKIITDLEKWQRLGGSGYQFFATDDEINYFLQAQLPDEFAPFSLITFDRVNKHGIVSDVPILKDIRAFLDLRERSYWNIYLRSLKLFPLLDMNKYRFIDDYLLLNGVISLHHGLITRPGGWDRSFMSYSDKIWNIETKEIILHKESKKLFNILKRRLRKMMMYHTYFIDKLGKKRDTRVLMTEKFAELVNSGAIKTMAIPGDLIKKK